MSWAMSPQKGSNVQVLQPFFQVPSFRNAKISREEKTPRTRLRDSVRNPGTHKGFQNRNNEGE